MIRVYRSGGLACELSTVDPAQWSMPSGTLWIDLINPTRDEDAAVERALGLSVPTREEMAELEASSRVYRENGVTYATADLITNGDDALPGLEPVTFVLTDGPLVTVRYTDPRPFAMLIEKLGRDPGLCTSGLDMFLNLMETVIDRSSNILSSNAGRVEVIAGQVFSGGRAVGFDRLITQLGKAQMASARIEQSLAGLLRVFAFVGMDERVDRDEPRAHLRSLGRDADSLIAHNQSVAVAINFQLSAALGLINIEQSSIIKIFSVAAVAFLPPTLIASIYGMNFQHMPELSQPWGYPAAVVAMVVSAILPLAWFKRKGWL
jgi:magnesium transporter